MMEIKHQDFIEAFPSMYCQISLWIMGSKTYGEERTQIRLSSPTRIDSVAKHLG